MTRAARQTKESTVQEQGAPVVATAAASEGRTLALNGGTRGKFVLFTIPVGERVEDGPVMRGFIETEAGKINVAGWRKTGRESGTDYLSLKVGNTQPRPAGASEDTPEEWTVGPFYGRLFRELGKVGEEGKAKRYFGFIEDSEKVGEDPATDKGVYRTHWQIQVRARPEVSNDGKTHYVSGTVQPRAAQGEATSEAIAF